MPKTAQATPQKRRWVDTLRDVDGLVEAHLRDARMGGRPLANLAAAMAIQHSDADRGALLSDEGRGFEPVLALEGNLSATAESDRRYDLELVDRARETCRTEVRGGAVAAPVLLDREVSSVLYLERDQGPLDPDTIELADALATRIGALLRSAALVEELARRNRNMTTLEALGECLAAGRIHQQHLDHTVEGVLHATGSDEAVLTLLDRQRGLPHTTRRCTDEGEPGHAPGDWIQLLEPGAISGAEPGISGPRLIESLWADLIPRDSAERRAVGFLAVRREPDRSEYDAADRSFFRAVAYLLTGALTRLEYFNQAAEDPLTETGSRLALQLGLAEARTQASDSGHPFSLILIDVDRFKEINDLLGHMVGDEVLREVAALLRSRLRATDSVHRYGGDEFVVILPQTKQEQAVGLAEELRLLIGRRPLTEHRVATSISVGVATSEPRAGDLGAVLHDADTALYRSKSLGRDRVTHANELADAS